MVDSILLINFCVLFLAIEKTINAVLNVANKSDKSAQGSDASSK